MVKSFTFKLLRRTFFISFLVALSVVIVGVFILWQRYQILSETQETEMEGIIEVVEQNIEQSLKYSYSAAVSLALQIDKNGEMNNFDEVAPRLVDNNPNIDGIQIVPDGVITKVYPYEENKEVINYNILQDSTRNEEAFKAIERRNMFFAGPFELKQGGFGIVGRLPVFIKDDFWGFVAVLIQFDNLINQSGVKELSGEKYTFQFSKIDPVTQKEKFFLETSTDLDRSHSEFITLPDGEWKIYIVPKNPNQPFLTLIPVAFLILILGAASGWIIYNGLKQPVILAERIRQQTADLARSERRFRKIFNQAAVGMVRVDHNTGMILESNKEFQDLLGYTGEELRNKDYKSITYREDLEESKDFMRNLQEGKIKLFKLEKRLLSKEGHPVWVSLSVTPLWSAGEEVSSNIAIVQDISARKIAETRLVENERRFRALVENSSEVILVIKENGEVIYNSPSLKRITGYEDLPSKKADLFSMVHPGDYSLLFEKLEYAREHPGEAFSMITIRVKTKCDTWIWVSAALANLTNEENIGGYVINLRDITERKEAELNLIKSYDFVMEQNKRLFNFAYIVSHNLRSHSSNMQSILDLYGIEDCEKEKQNYIKLLQNVSDNLHESLHDLNEVVSINTNLDIKVEPIKVADYLKKTINLLRLQIRSVQARIKSDVPENMVVPFNSAYMESVLLNFLTNSLRYSHPDRLPIIEVRGYSQNGCWILEIEDNGIGMDLERHGEKVFGLYKTFSGRKDARGVGLFITKNQINAMGGIVEVRSKLGKGTTFKVYFNER